MIGGAHVYTFRFICIDDTVYEKRFVAPSEQMVWVMAAGYVACHTLNPSVKGITLVKKDYIVEVAIEPGEISEHVAIHLIHNL